MADTLSPEQRAAVEELRSSVPARPERRNPQRGAQAQPQQAAQSAQPQQAQPQQAQQQPDPRETQSFQDRRRVLLNEVFAGVIPFVEAAVDRFMSGPTNRTFDQELGEARGDLRASQERLGPEATSTIENIGMVGGSGLMGAAGAGVGRGIGRPIIGGSIASGATGFARGATEPEAGASAGERIASGIQQGGLEAIAGAGMGGAMRGVGAARRGMSNRRARRDQQTAARAEDLTSPPRGPGGVGTDQPEGFFAEISRGVANNQSIEQIARRTGASQEEVARTLTRNRDRFQRVEPGTSSVRIGGEQRTLDERNVTRLMGESRDVVRAVERAQGLPSSARPTRQTTSGTQRNDMDESLAPTESVRRTPQDAIEQGRTEAAQASQERLPNSMRATRGARATGQRPARTKLENMQVIRDNLTDDNAEAVARELNVEPGPDVRRRVLEAVERLGPATTSAIAAVVGGELAMGDE